MSLSIPAAWEVFIQKAHQTAEWLWLWELVLDEGTGGRPIVRLVNHPEEVDLGSSVIYYPFPIVHSAIEENSDGDMPQMEVQLDNSSKLLAPYVDQGGGFLNRLVTLRLANADDLSVWFQFDFTVTACALTTQSATLRLEVDNWFQRQVPLDVFHTYRCRHIFGDARCGYVVNTSAAYRDCEKHIDDCWLRGQDMIARNLGARQPASFGGFLGIPLA